MSKGKYYNVWGDVETGKARYVEEGLEPFTEGKWVKVAAGENGYTAEVAQIAWEHGYAEGARRARLKGGKR